MKWPLRIGGLLIGVMLSTAGRGMRADPGWNDLIGWTLYLGGMVLVFWIFFLWDRTRIFGRSSENP